MERALSPARLQRPSGLGGCARVLADLRLGCRRHGGPCMPRQGLRRRHQLPRHLECLWPRRRREVARRSASDPSPRLLRARDEALLSDGRHRREQGAVAPAGLQADRRLAPPAPHRPRRPLPVPPLRPADPARGDDGGPDGSRPPGKGPLPRLQRVDAGGDPRGARPNSALREVRLQPAAVLDPLACPNAR
jgi:hypothetical protein